MTKEPTEGLDDLYSMAEDELNKLKDRLEKIIVAKKKLSADTNKKEILVGMENMEKISLKLPESIKEIRELGQKISSLLGPQVELKSATPKEKAE